MAAFRRLTIGPAATNALVTIARKAPPLYDCIRGELQRLLSDGFDPKELLPDILEPHLHGFDCCQMTLLLSVKGDRVHLTGVLPARNQLRGILP